MDKKISSDKSGIGGSLTVLAQVLGLAVESVGEAQVLQFDGKQQEAVDALIGLETRLTEGHTLYQAILTLHRHR